MVSLVVVGAGQAGLAVSRELDLAGVDHVVLERAWGRAGVAGPLGQPVFDGLGFPVAADDLTTAVPGLLFCGVHVLRTSRSSLLYGVGRDAARGRRGRHQVSDPGWPRDRWHDLWAACRRRPAIRGGTVEAWSRAPSPS